MKTISRIELVSKLPVFGYLCVCLTAFFFAYLAVNAPSTYLHLGKRDVWIVKEDSWVENFTAIWLFLAGLLLIVTAFLEHRVLPTYIYILGGIALLFGAGEEISWGQRIFEFHTPDYLKDINRQREFNVHNIGVLMPFVKFDYYCALILCIIACAAFSQKRHDICEIPLPSIPLVFCFMITLSHVPLIKFGGIPAMTLIFTSSEKTLLLFFIIYMLFERQIPLPLIISATTTMIPILVFSYIYSSKSDGFYTPGREFREYLFGFCCFLYSLELLLFQAQQTENSSIDGFHRQFYLGRFPLWLAVSLIVITGSIWLATLTYLKAS